MIPALGLRVVQGLRWLAALYLREQRGGRGKRALIVGFYSSYGVYLSVLYPV